MQINEYNIYTALRCSRILCVLLCFIGVAMPSHAQGIWCSSNQVIRTTSSSSVVAYPTTDYRSKPSHNAYRGASVSFSASSTPSFKSQNIPNNQTYGMGRQSMTYANSMSGAFKASQGRVSMPMTNVTAPFAQSAASSLSVSGVQRRIGGGGGTGGMVATSFYNWLNTTGTGNGAYLYGDGDYWYYDMSTLEQLFNEWLSLHQGDFGGAEVTWEQFLQWFYDYERQTWFRAPLGNGIWIMIILAIIYMLIKYNTKANKINL